MTSTNSFFDLKVSGLGYVNRVRTVNVKRGTPFVACDIAALTGPADDVEYRRFDVNVVGKEAEKLMKRIKTTVEDRKAKGLDDPKILISFTLGDIWTDTFTYNKGERAGQTGVSLKARLLFISWIKVDGEMVYKHERADHQQQTDTPAQPEPEHTNAPQPTAAIDTGGSASAGEYAPAQPQPQPQYQTETADEAIAAF
ncbi:STY4534 family ICE replication protein [Carnimonas bestiolae]|uniref:STY4534 family ICE replication protein n=1 Tax=Carnimonas bestiolae TaxID=3402172 RepID=UPI003EDB7D7D